MMLEEHSNKDMLLEKSVKQIILETSTESIPKFIENGTLEHNAKADEYLEMLNWNADQN